MRTRHVLRHRDQGQPRTAQGERRWSRACRGARGTLLNLPAGTDVRRMREQLSRMERRLDQLTDEVAEVDERRSAHAGGVMAAHAQPHRPRHPRSTATWSARYLRARNGVRYVRGTHRPKLGATPKEVVWKRGKAELWRYATATVRYGPPVVIVHSLVSRSYILDLRPGNSLVEYLHRRRAGRLHARLGRARRARRRQRPGALRRLVHPAGARRRPARDGPIRGDAGRLLPRRRHGGALRRRRTRTPPSAT